MPNTNGTRAATREELEQQVEALERQLQAGQAREHVLRQLLDNIPAAIYATGGDGVVLFANRTFASEWGRSPAEFEGRSLDELFPPEVAAAWRQNVDSGIRAAATVTNHETYGEGPQARHYDNLRFPVYDAAGAAVALGGVATDITEQVRAAADYSDTRRLLEGLVHNSPAAIAVRSAEGRLMLVNESYAALHGHSAAELHGHTEDELLPDQEVEARRERARALFASGAPLHSRGSLLVDGEERTLVSTLFPLYTETRQPYAICSITTDVTELRRAEQEREQLQNAIIEAQRAALRELNTPLIPLAQDVVVMPLVGSIDSQRAAQVMETLLEGVTQQRARLAILDITGLAVMDSQVASVLLQAAQAVKLLGAEVVLTGIGAEVAQTLVGIGADLSGMKTPGTLQAGIAYALRQRR